MRRLVPVSLSAVSLSAVSLSAVSLIAVSLIAAVALQGQAAAGPGRQVASPGQPADDPARGVDHSDLRLSGPDGPCHGNFELGDRRDRAGHPLCTHGPDPAPPGVDVRRALDLALAPATQSAPNGTAATGSVACDGDGTSGNRVQLLYVHATDVADRSASLAAKFRQWATKLDNVFSSSAAETGGDRHVRFVHDAACNPIVTDVAVSPTGDDAFAKTLDQLRAKGFTRTDRKYVAWVDANRYCGMAQVYYDDSPGQANASNGSATVPGELARIDSGCWGQANSVEAHELMHTLGGVQTSAPHATRKNHCSDEYDRMCYDDGSGVPLEFPCPSSHDGLFDCNHDDYYSTAPASGSYLASHWNTAASAFLIGSGQTGPPPTIRPATTTTTAPPPSTTTTVARTGTPSAPQSLSATQPATGSGIVLAWSAPATPGAGPVTSYKVYRGSSVSTLGLLATVSTTGYADAGASSGTVSYYQVSAVNAAGEGPRSNYAATIAK